MTKNNNQEENNETNNETNEYSTGPLTKRVKEIKLIARDTLRMELISPRLSKISLFEKIIEEIKEQDISTNLLIEIEKYEINKLDTNHPIFEKQKKDKKLKIKIGKENLKESEKRISILTQRINEQKEAITKIEKGETLVSKTFLDDLVNEMILKEKLNNS